MARLIAYLRRYANRPHVRPWALLAPVAVLLIALPLLRPLRHPDPRDISHDETALLASIRAVGETGSLVVDPRDIPDGRRFVYGARDGAEIFGDHPPVFAAMLGVAYRFMLLSGLTLEENSTLVPYLLTVLGSAVPVALSAGLIYRLGRLFEIPRRRRVLFALAATLASGLIVYATVLNPHAPAAALVLLAVSALVQVAMSKNPARGGGFVAVAGFCAACAAVVDPYAIVFLVLLLAVPLAVRWSGPQRVGGVLLYLIGCSPPILLHAVLNLPITGDLWPGFLHPERAVTLAGEAPPPEPISLPARFDSDEDEVISASMWVWIGKQINRLALALVGPFGLFSHFPVLVFGIGGVFAVMHRNWPGSTKALAAATLVGAGSILLAHAWSSRAYTEPMFASRAFVIFSPLLMLWTGAWLRQQRHIATRIIAGVLLGISIVISLAGATQPLPRGGYQTYTAAAAVEQLFSDSKSMRDDVIVGR